MARISVVILAILMLAAVSNAATVETGVFTGVVRDGNGGAVAGATVTATNRQFQRGTTVFTDTSGRFRLPAIEAGTYDLRVRRVGYKDRADQGLQLGDGTTRLD